MYEDRQQAGRQLAEALSAYRQPGVVVFALPRGGVVVSAEVARSLQAPLGTVVVQRIGHPMSSAYTVGAVTEHDWPVWDRYELGFTIPKWRKAHVEMARQEAKRQRIRYEGDRAPLDATGKTAILVDDGVTTGIAMIAAVKELRRRKVAAVIVAVPVAHEDAVKRMRPYVNQLIVLHVPVGYFGSPKAFYRQYPAVSDEEVRSLIGAYRDVAPSEPLDLESVNAVLATVPEFPVTSGEMTQRAKSLHAPANVVAFFESIPTAVAFRNKADVMRRTEETGVLRQQAAGEPPEALHSYD